MSASGWFLVMTLCLVLLSESQAQTELTPREIARRSLPSVVLILCADGENVSLGSGFFLRPGIVVTNYHVVEGMTAGFVKVAVGAETERRSFRIARLVAFDKTADLALLSVPDAFKSGIPTLGLVPESYRVEVGEPVYALGNPEGLVGTMSPGIVSAAVRTFRDGQRIQITAPLSSGSSGGPIVNGAGKVVGIAKSSLSEGQNLNFAVPIASLYSLVKIAEFPDDRRNYLDRISNSDSSISPWAGPLPRSTSTAGTTRTAPRSPPITRQNEPTATDWYLQGNSSFDKGRYDEAISSYSKAIELNPRLAIAYLGRGTVYLSEKKLDYAIADFGKAIQLDPKNFQAYNNRGRAYSTQGKRDMAIADFSAAIRLNPQISALYRNRGSCYRDQGKLELAVGDFTQAIQLDPQNRYPYLLRANVFSRQEKFDVAVADYSAAIDIDPKYWEAYLMRASALSDQGKYDEAFGDFATAIRLNPQSAVAYYNRGVAYHEQQKYEKAIPDYTKAIQLDPRLDRPYGSRARAYDIQGKHELAIADYSKSLELNPKNTNLYVERAWAKLYGNDGDGAYHDVATFLKLSGPDGESAPYAVLVGFLSLRKGLKNADSNVFLSEWLGRMQADAWTSEIMRFFLGQLTEEALLAKATDTGKRTEAHTYIGSLKLLSGKRESATEHFRWVKENGNKGFTEYLLALAELKRLQ